MREILAILADDGLAREAANVMWLITLVILGLSFFSMMFTNFEPGWFKRTATMLAFGLFLFFIVPEGMRSAFQFALVYCRNRYDDCTSIEDNVWIVLVAPFLAALIGVFLLWVISPRHLRPWSWLVPSMAIFGSYVGYYFL